MTCTMVTDELGLLLSHLCEFSGGLGCSDVPEPVVVGHTTAQHRTLPTPDGGNSQEMPKRRSVAPPLRLPTSPLPDRRDCTVCSRSRLQLHRHKQQQMQMRQ